MTGLLPNSDGYPPILAENRPIISGRRAKNKQNSIYAHGLKPKGISNASVEKLEASGHRTASMLNVYDVKMKSSKTSND